MPGDVMMQNQVFDFHSQWLTYQSAIWIKVESAVSCITMEILSHSIIMMKHTLNLLRHKILQMHTHAFKLRIMDLLSTGVTLAMTLAS